MDTQVTLWAVDAEAVEVAQQLRLWLQEMEVPSGEVREARADEVAARCAEGLQGPTLWIGGCGVGGSVAGHVATAVDQALPGLAALAYPLWFERLGSAATRYQIAGGWKGGHLCVALPGQLDAARAVLEHLLIPEWVHGYSTESHPAPSGVSRAQEAQARVQQEERGAPPAEEDRGAWQRALSAAGASLDRGTHHGLTPQWAAFAPLANVLEQAGEHASAVLPSGERVGLWGFPDLRRPGSRVLSVGGGDAWPEVVALHRYPARVGTCVAEQGGWFGGDTWTVQQACSEVVGEAPPEGAEACFAIDRATVYVCRGGSVYAWDGREERDEGTPKQALASLVLRWSNR